VLRFLLSNKAKAEMEVTETFQCEISVPLVINHLQNFRRTRTHTLSKGLNFIFLRKETPEE
jgi:hypothetical protein